VFKQISIAWHNLFHLKSNKAGRRKKESSHRHAASKQLVSLLKKKIKAEKKVSQKYSAAFRKAMAGLRKIGFTKPQSESQAAALELVYDPNIISRKNCSVDSQPGNILV